MNIQNKLDHLLKRVEKPGRYIGGELNSAVKQQSEGMVNFAFCFPDLYEIGMSYLGLQILYNLLNKRENIYCQRVFQPAQDMEELMRQENMPLFTLETKAPLMEMDAIGFTLQYEMSYTTVLNMIDLAGMPILSSERGEEYPLVMAGGPCAYNPEPLADFVDVFLIGDGEEVLPEVLEMLGEAKKKGLSKVEFLESICGIDGVYVPAFYDVKYNEDGTVKEFCKLNDKAPDRVRRGVVSDIENIDFPVNPLIPMVEAVHDRAVIETFRGCTRGCRFCQAGFIYRPVRERSGEKVLELAVKQLENTGHEELSLLSLSTSDHSCFENMVNDIIDYTKKNNVSVSLPSLRMDKFAFDVLNRIQEYKKSGLTYAPEAGTQRLRDVINKGVTENDIFTSISQAMELGWRHVKLYFMIGLPTETYADLDGIADIARRIRELSCEYGAKGKFSLTVSVSNFVPKADTPFQWCAQNTAEEFAAKHKYLTEKLRIKGVTFNYHDNITSTYEAVFARGDRRTGKLLMDAFRNGCKLDGWTEHFNAEGWEKAFESSNTDIGFYTTRERSLDEVLPWHIVDCSVSDRYLLNEYKKAMAETTTQDCRHGCTGCGMNQRTECRLGGIYE